MKIMLLLLLYLSSSQVFALSSVRSHTFAYRSLKVDYSVYEKRALIQEKQKGLASSGNSALRASKIYSETSFTGKIVRWKSISDMQKRFEEIRDERFLFLKSEPDFPRRISWLYPKDGCFVRAALFNRNAFRMFVPVPNKVFAFGNLRVKTVNAARGVVGWWYHVAPIVQVGEEKYVLDPSIDHDKPLPIKEWLSKMGNPSRIKVAI